MAIRLETAWRAFALLGLMSATVAGPLPQSAAPFAGKVRLPVSLRTAEGTLLEKGPFDLEVRSEDGAIRLHFLSSSGGPVALRGVPVDATRSGRTRRMAPGGNGASPPHGNSHRNRRRAPQEQDGHAPISGNPAVLECHASPVPHRGPDRNGFGPLSRKPSLAARSGLASSCTAHAGEGEPSGEKHFLEILDSLNPLLVLILISPPGPRRGPKHKPEGPRRGPGVWTPGWSSLSTTSSSTLLRVWNSSSTPLGAPER